MTISFPRFFAATLLFVGGAVVGFSVFAIVAARVVIASGVPVVISPADVALLDDLVQLMPFVGAFAVANVIAGIALVSGRPWADRLATTVSAVAVGIGVFAMILVILGHDAFSAAAVDRALAGLRILGTFVALYGAVIVALALDGKPVVRAATQAAA